MGAENIAARYTHRLQNPYEDEIICAVRAARDLSPLPFFRAGKDGKTPSKKFDKTLKPRALSFGVCSLFSAKTRRFLTIRTAR